MSDLDRRLSRTSDGLSARERVILILRADVEGLSEDPAWRRIPDFQGSEFNHFIVLANGTNHVLVPHATVLLCEVETLEALSAARCARGLGGRALPGAREQEATEAA